MSAEPTVSTAPARCGLVDVGRVRVGAVLRVGGLGCGTRCVFGLALLEPDLSRIDATS